MSAAQFARRFAILAFGFAWGAVLVYAGMYMSGAGHGTYVPFALATSPLSLFPLYFGSRHSFWIVIFVVPLWWALLFALSTAVHVFWRRVWVLFVLAHYAGVALLIYRTDYAYGMHWRALRGMLHFRPAYVVGTLLLYAIGQAVMWHEATRKRPLVVSTAEPLPVGNPTDIARPPDIGEAPPLPGGPLDHPHIEEPPREN